MKKIIFLSAFLPVMLLACNQNPLRPGSGAQPSRFKPADSIPRDAALKMIHYYRDHHLDGRLIGQRNQDTMSITLDNSDLYDIFKLDNITRIRLFFAAYDSVYPDKSLQNKVILMIQLKQGYNSTYSYYPGNFICPPPNGCSIE
jgi:hypothetical protein